MLVLGLIERPHLIELSERKMEDESRHQPWKFNMQKHICHTHTKNKYMHTHMKHGERKKECLTYIKKILNIQQGFNMCKKNLSIFLFQNR